MEMFSPVFLPPEFLICVISLALSVGSELRVPRKTQLIPKIGGKAHPSLVNPPKGSSAGTWWVKKTERMEKIWESEPWHSDSEQFLQSGRSSWRRCLDLLAEPRARHEEQQSSGVEPSFAWQN